MSHARHVARTARRRLRIEPLEARVVLDATPSILFLGGAATPSMGADGTVMSFLESRFGAVNVEYKQASATNNTTDLVDVDTLVLSSTPGSGDYRSKFHSSAVGIVNWEEAVMDADAGEFGLASSTMTKSTNTTQMTIAAVHPITEGLSGTISFVTSGETLGTNNLYPGLTSLVTAANGTTAGYSSVFIAEAGQNVDPASGASPAAGRRVMFPMTDTTFNNVSADGQTLLENAVRWVAGLDEVTEPSVVNQSATDVTAVAATLAGEVTDAGGQAPTVTLFYGDEDGGAVPTAWDDSVDVGAQGGAFNATVGGLSPDTTYFFTSRAENAAGTVWASPSLSFTTLTLAPATVVNNAATDVTSSSALLTGQVTDTGNDPPDVTIYYGDEDGGTETTAWDASLPLGTQQGAFSAVAAGLDPLTTYYFRARAVNAAGESWAPSAALFTTATVALDDVAMYNDHVVGPLTHASATTYAANGVTSGLLKNIDTGADTTLTLSVTASTADINFAGSSAFPSDGTDAYDVFDGVIDFTTATGASIELDGADFYTHNFSGLDPLKAYDFVGTAVRGNDDYTNRWTLVTLEGAESAVAAHSTGVGVVTAGLTDEQVALWVGANHNPTQGFVAQWTDIDPGPDGAFSIRSTQYTGAVPTSVNASGFADGSKGYGLSAIRLTERFTLMGAVAVDPIDGQRLVAPPTTATIDFSVPVDPASIAAGDLTVDGVAAVGVTIVDPDTVRWDLPAGLAAGPHQLEIASDAVVADDGLAFVGFASSFIVVASPQVDNAPAQDVSGTSARLAAEVVDTGFEDPEVVVYWGASDGGTDTNAWDASVSLGHVGAGTHLQQLTGLTGSTQYFYRATASNQAGDSWAPATASFTTLPVAPPTVTTDPATEVGGQSARLGGTVTNTGNDSPAVTVYFGQTDGGTTSAAWDDSVSVGTQSDAFSTLVLGLSPETTYFFRVYAENVAGSEWADASQTFTTLELPILRISEVMAGNQTTLLTRTRATTGDPFAGDLTSPDWIEIQNLTAETVDLGGFHLTDDADLPTRWAFPLGTMLPAGDYLVVFASGLHVLDPALDEQGYLHTNFSLAIGGEYLALTRSDGEVVHEYAPRLPKQASDFSYGLDSVGFAHYFGNPTPGSANDETSLLVGLVDDTRFSVDRGFYDAPIDVEIASDTPGASIVYTTDGTVPTLTNGTLVPPADASTPPLATVHVTTTTTLRAAAFKTDWIETNVDTHTYVFIDDVVQQPNDPAGFPTTWSGAPAADYEMDPEIVNDPDYQQVVVDGLRAIPTLSVVLPVADLFGTGGIYVNTTNSSLEKAASAELILPDGSTGFQIDAGLKIQGGASRNPSSSPKHSLSLRFRDVYGAGRLDYPVFADTNVTSFDSIHLRAMYNNSWIHWASDQRLRGTLMRDQWMRDSLLAMGQEDAGVGTYMHLYLNGVYWGVYNVHERQEASHYAAYQGGDEVDYDAINGGSPVDGNLTAYNAMKATVAGGDWAAIQQVLDVDNYIDWTIIQRFGSNNDLKSNGNWKAAGGGPDNAPWRFYSWDGERVLEGVNEGGPGGTADPPGILNDLLLIEEFRVRFGDRIHEHFFNAGALTPSATSDRWSARVAELNEAIVAESARWGDYRRDVHQLNCGCFLYNRDDHWIVESLRLVDDYFPLRSDIVLNQYRNINLYAGLPAPLYPDLAAPELNQHGGIVPDDFELTMTAPTGVVYYTTNGADPRLPGGTINTTDATAYAAPVDVGLTTTVKARAYDAGADEWSALTEAVFIINPAAADNLAISEINYNPAQPTAAELAVDPLLDAQQFEFIELTNTAGVPISLVDAQFELGAPGTIELDAGPVSTLDPGQSVVVVRNLDAFRIRYGTGLDDRIAGSFTDGGLNNGGERITLIGADGSVIQSFSYDDNAPWPSTTDGLGFSLVLNDPASNPDHANPFNWRASAALGGSPGAVDPAGPAAIVVNEALSNSDGALLDAIELYNPTGADVNVGGWFLTDNEDVPQKYQIADPTIIPAGGYLTFDETQFNADGDPNAFGLSAGGDEVFLFSADPAGGALTGYMHGFAFGAAADNIAFIRHVDSTGYEHFTAQADPGTSLGGANEPFRGGEVVITELHYNPKTSDPGETFVDEFIEIQNISDAAIPLFDPDNPANTWVVNGAAFALPQGASLAPGEVALVVAIDPETFRTTYSLPAELQIFGPFFGSLSDGGETISLQRPTAPAPETPLIVPLIDVDVVRFDDDPPWTTLPDGGNGDGSSLTRLATDNFGSEPLSWTAVEPTPGTAFTIRHVVGRHLFYNESGYDTPNDADAIATDKTPLLPGETATSASYTSYQHGINGLIIDVLSPNATPVAGDFTFRVGNVDDTSSWQPAHAPATFGVDAGGGEFGATRVTITWAGGDITGQWLETTIAASLTGTSDVFYYGSAIGETGNDPSNALVTAADLIAIRNNPRGDANRARITTPHDVNRDRLVDATDALLARNAVTGPFDALRLITPSLPPAAPPEAEGAPVGATGRLSASERPGGTGCLSASVRLVGGNDPTNTGGQAARATLTSGQLTITGGQAARATRPHRVLVDVVHRTAAWRTAQHRSAASSTSCSVVAQSMQPSVIDWPWTSVSGDFGNG